MKEVFKIWSIFNETKTACLKKIPAELEKYIVERYDVLEKTSGKEFVLENVKLNAATAAYTHRIIFTKELSKARLEKFLKRECGNDVAILKKLDVELKVAKFPFTAKTFITHLIKMNEGMDRPTKRKKRRRGTIIIKIPRRPR